MAAAHDSYLLSPLSETGCLWTPVARRQEQNSTIKLGCCLRASRKPLAGWLRWEQKAGLEGPKAWSSRRFSHSELKPSAISCFLASFLKGENSAAILKTRHRGARRGHLPTVFVAASLYLPISGYFSIEQRLAVARIICNRGREEFSPNMPSRAVPKFAVLL